MLINDMISVRWVREQGESIWIPFRFTTLADICNMALTFGWYCIKLILAKIFMMNKDIISAKSED